MKHTRDISRGLKVSRRSPLRPILAQWSNLNYHFGSQWVKSSNDAPWWYNERASLSFFAGAVWKSRGWAFEEFIANRMVRKPGTPARQMPGRCDISFGIGDLEFLAEAKQCWPSLGNLPPSLRKINASLQDALDQCRSIDDWGIPAYAMVFASPRVNATRGDQVEHLLGEFIGAICELRNVQLAWAFPPLARALHPTGRNKHRIYPGIALILKRAS